jgi:hypothetical protein
MAPFLVSALVGVGVKLVTDLIMSGAKSMMKGGKDASSASGAEGASFASTLDKARGPSAASTMTAASGATATDFGLGERSRVMATGAADVAADARATAVATYRRLNAVESP